MKSIIKEILIILLLCLAICLILGIIFYNYIPSNVVVPGNVEAYATSNTIKEEIDEEIVEYPKENLVFEITDSDLTLYKRVKSYDEGKSNPFAITNQNTTTTTTGTGTVSKGGANSSSAESTTQVEQNTEQTTTNNNNVTNTETFYQDTKLK